ncbi:MAG: apolipoprotein N-acyltransferase [Deferribacteraceae bacterium]|nr:apolipoprotein N-acyltransferase [Deferribacteraceae bacterium]
MDLALCIVAASLLLAATPGFDLWVCAFLAFALIAYIFDRGKIKPYKSAFLIGFIYYTVGASWISVPMTLFGGAPEIASAGLVLFTGVVTALWFWVPYGYVIGRTNSTLLGGIVFIALEMMKGKYLFGGLPWLNIGLTQVSNKPALQIVSIIGEHGLSLLVILIGGYLYKVIKLKLNKEQFSKELGVVLGLLLLTFGFGGLKLILNDPQTPTHTARLVQTGILQEDKWDRSKRAQVLADLVSRVDEAGSAQGDYDLMVLPESSFTANPFTHADVSALVRKVSADKPLILGFDRRDEAKNIYNTMAIVKEGGILQSYDKMKLAPFGEYFPFERQLYPIRRFFFGDGALFTAGTTPQIFTYDDMRMAPLICFEGVFSELIRERVLMGANILLMISNDAWFGKSLGRIQHLDIEVVRAVEYGRYMLRTTQDGISAVISPYGDKEVVFPEKMYYFSDTGFSLEKHITPFARFGYVWYVLLICGYAIRLMVNRRSS